MAEFKVRTRGESDPRGKARVYFTCHPADFDKYFGEICEDIFRVNNIDCAIYYTEDMTEPLNATNVAIDLPHANLFVIPVTYKLLTEDNRAMREDVECAKKHNIPILPFMMEQGIDNIYSLAKKFGSRQYINPNSTDETEIRYDEKLKKYLESVILANETLRFIRNEFTTYIFLSYRKKDRERANELMRLIHGIPACRSLAVWYDEFLTVCESFEDIIEEAMDRSNVFVLLVTPNILEDGNYVMTEEYPMAISKGMDILPIEMEPTDRQDLVRKYPGIPNCINPNNDTEISDAIMKSLPGLKFSARRPKTPEHNYLMGLAYLNGVDVEINYEIAVEFLELAADGGMLKAMTMLFNMFINGEHINIDYERALVWAERIVDYCTRELGEFHATTLMYIGVFAHVCRLAGDYSRSLENYDKAYELSREILGEDNINTINHLSGIAYAHDKLKNHKKAIELFKKVYSLRCKVLGEEHIDTLTSLGDIAAEYDELGEPDKAIELKKRVYDAKCRILGDDHPGTLQALGNLSYSYSIINDHPKTLKLRERVYAGYLRIYGEKHPMTIIALSNLASTYSALGDHWKALELKKKTYTLSCEVLGDEHPETLNDLNNLAYSLCIVGDYEESFKLYKKLYEIRCRLLGEEHPDTVSTKGDVALLERCLADDENHIDGIVEIGQQIMEITQKSYLLKRHLYGNNSPDTAEALKKYADSSLKYGDNKQALELYEKLYEIQVGLWGEDHPDVLETKKIIDTLRRII